MGAGKGEQGSGHTVRAGGVREGQGMGGACGGAWDVWMGAETCERGLGHVKGG